MKALIKKALAASWLLTLTLANSSLTHADEAHVSNNNLQEHDQAAESYLALSQHQLNLSAGIATTYRTDDASDPALWQIPGVLMGGDAVAPQQGISLDDAWLSLSWNNQRSVNALFELSQHGDHDPKLEQGYVSYSHQFGQSLDAKFSAGRLKGAFSPENSTHASGRSFSENNLLYAAFFGAHYSDEGVRIALSPGSTGALTIGAELWRGSHFPATSGSGGGAQDLYLHWRGQTGKIHWQTGLWAFLARAEGRGDDRFEDGHNHGNDIEGRDAEDNNIDFDGTQRLAGMFASVRWQAWSAGDIRLQGELMDINAEGEITDPTRRAELDGSYQGFYLQPEIRFEQHHVALRYARLILDNHITGAGGAGLATEAGLADMGRDPSMWGLSYRYLFEQGIGLRLEWTSNETTRNDNDYFGIGVFWHAVLF